MCDRTREGDRLMGESQESPAMVCLSLSGSPLRFQRRFSTFSRRTAPLRDPPFFFYFFLYTYRHK